MISTKKELRFYIYADRIIAGKPKNIKLKRYLKGLIAPDYIARYLFSMRHVAYYENKKVKTKFSLNYAFHKWNFRRLGVKLGFTIGCNCFGYGLLIPHYGTIVINGGIRAGNYCVLHTSTCIGGSDKKIGDGLYLSSGGFIMGTNVILGDNISIASNSLVNKSFTESNILLAGTPANIKGISEAWYERDGLVFKKRVEKIEKLKNSMKL